MTSTSDIEPLVTLGRWLRETQYEFVPVTPATHSRILRRIERAASLRDIFGWSAPFQESAFPQVAELLRAVQLLEFDGTWAKSKVRFASFAQMLFAHSSFPTVAPDSVFFGPDTLRFLRALRSLPPPYGRLIDIGTGTGVAGISLAPHAREVWLTDVSPLALVFARANAIINDVGSHVFPAPSNVLDGVEGSFDTIVANPPFLADPMTRMYRDGGGIVGTGLGVRIVTSAMERLAPQGRLLVYSGAPVVRGTDMLKTQLLEIDRSRVASWQYEEIDPDIFGEELEEPGYGEVERIAAVVLQVRVA